MLDKFTLNIPESAQFGDAEFFDFCQQNPDLKFERDQHGKIIVMSPTGSETGNKNSILIYELMKWNQITQKGLVFDSSSGFTLPNTAVRAADVAWIANTRWNALSQEEREVFAPICPDFVIELMSKSDSLKEAQTKMQEWMDNGCRLAWLLDPKNQKAYIYRLQQNPEIVDDFQQKLSGEQVLPDFELDLGVLG